MRLALPAALVTLSADASPIKLLDSVLVANASELHVEAAVAAPLGTSYPWTCVFVPSANYWYGFNVAPDGNIECYGTNGEQCVVAMDQATCNTMLATNPFPTAFLKCGCMRKSIYGAIGYDIPGHWCTVGVATFNIVPPNEDCNPTPQPTPSPTPSPTP
ncbi:hypothetical protein As57867_003805, partial [Aphanomyces stellatus]